MWNGSLREMQKGVQTELLCGVRSCPCTHPFGSTFKPIVPVAGRASGLCWRRRRMSFKTASVPERELLAATLCYRLYKDRRYHEVWQRKQDGVLWIKTYRKKNCSCTGWKQRRVKRTAKEHQIVMYDGGLYIEEKALCHLQHTCVHALKLTREGTAWDMSNGRVSCSPPFTSSLLHFSSLWMTADGGGMCGPAESHDNCH